MKDRRRVLLLIEDDPNDRLITQSVLGKVGAGYRVQMVRNGQEGIDYLDGVGPYADRQKFPFPTILITDLKMPILDGFGVLEHIQNHPQWSIIPMVVLSASQDTDDIHRAYQLGANSYLFKPQGYEELSGLLLKLFDYWTACEVPQVDERGQEARTDCHGKLGARYAGRTS
ncbi:MAG: response regulator receiver protein [Verrucomicrobiales bacterium]|nr:response regulator receiver protein [Verrucomicrobiales bacterium]